MIIGLDESGQFGKPVRFGEVMAEEDLTTLLRLYITLEYGHPFPPKSVKISEQELVCANRLIRRLEADTRFNWRIHFLTAEDQFLVASAFSEFEAREAADVLRKVEERISVAGSHLLAGVGSQPNRESDLYRIVNPRSDQEWRSAVLGWWNNGRDWVRRHRRYLGDERRPDRFTKALAYLCICHRQAEDEKFINWYIDGGAPMVFWRRTLDGTSGHHYVHGVTLGDETHPFITAADRIARAFPRMNGMPHDNEHLRHVDLKAQLPRMEELRYQFKTTVTDMRPRDLILLEKDAFPHGPSTALPEALRDRLDSPHRFPELLPVEDVDDFLRTYPEVADGVAFLVAKKPDDHRAPLRNAQRMSTDEAWEVVQQEVRVLEELARASHLTPQQQHKVLAKLKNAGEDWARQISDLQRTGRRERKFGAKK